MKLEIFEKGDIIFFIDEKGDKFYLILHGKIGLYAKDNFGLFIFLYI